MKRNYFFFALGLLPLWLGLLGKFHWLLDVFTHFRIYYLLYFILLLMWGIFRKDRFQMIASGLVVFFLSLSLSPFYLSANKKSNNSSLKIAAINLWSGNRSHTKVQSYLIQEDFDLILFQEYTPSWDNALRPLNLIYPHSKKEVRSDNFGIALFSKIPFENIDIQRLSKYGLPTIIAKTTLNNQPLTIIGSHPPPPVDPSQFKDRNNQFKKLNAIAKVAEKNSEVILLGDFNCTNWSPNFSFLTKETSLRDTRKGFGIQNSWNADWWFLNVPIDHALVSDGLVVLDRKLGAANGSDHAPIELTITTVE